ncbi:LytR/AlgR family response regulator transcription factor [Runella slithyformis]|uniref:Two component transcriptional regulator, LytTR family n=1 Tax=Runella slithyformis (strain ATCC 29530 / DSM 19594 / LMG 11500 / NCIMB 11436 / LSU 4) TaxID=761193 RepID=A0A7U3ZJX5_RUNSL|nr:response regulator [Runella slithyformis]AEI48505.1 two component transcriptional regulator, LytTR family [Runella slithyformis DSM 19594]
MHTVKILIVEDEAVVGLDLEARLEEDGYEIVNVVNNGSKAIEIYKSIQVDLILCDIKLIGTMTGIEAVREMIAFREAPVIYLTAQADRSTIEAAMKTYPSAYITKPFSTESLKIAIDLAINNFALHSQNQSFPKHRDETVKPLHPNAKSPDRETILQINDYVFIKENYKFQKLFLGDILFFEADKNYTTIHTDSKKIALRLTLNTVLERLSAPKFIRVHRSYAVNIDKIDSFDEHDLYVGKFQIPIGRSHKEEFMRYFMFR